VIPPAQQWCVQIDITNACMNRCSNCTRLLAHAKTPFFMDTETFEKAVIAVKDFPKGKDRLGRRRVIGIMGGEPLLHPKFAEFVDIICEHVPDPVERGLWTAIDFRSSHRHKASCVKLLGSLSAWRDHPKRKYGYLNLNTHEAVCKHQSLLIASKDVIPDEVTRKAFIDKCWVQRRWASGITPKGFFFCEVAAAFDMIFNGPGGLPLEPGVWKRPLSDFEAQMDWCNYCSAAIPLKPRKDNEEIDDVSPTTLQMLKDIGSPCVANGKYCLITEDSLKLAGKEWQPYLYRN